MRLLFYEAGVCVIADRGTGMSYTALYRKFRPDNFDDVKGQDHIVKTLRNQILADRIGHAYLFCGTRGTGKTTVAKILAKAVNCEHPDGGNPCNKCASCRAIAAGSSMNVIEIDAASNNGVDNIRDIREEVMYAPTEGKYKVYIIDEVHMLSTGAFNALLKTLEEPPAYVIFILATTEAQKIPVTILSRCQRYDFRRIGQETILERLQELMRAEQVDAEEKALRYIAKKGDGSLRDALSLLDQCIAFYLGETLTYDRVLEVLGAVDTEVFSDFLRKILDEDLVNVIRSLDTLIMQGRDLSQFVNDFTWYMRNLMLLKASDEMEEVLDISSENLERLSEEASMIRSDTLMRYIRIFSELASGIRYASNRRVLVEIALIKLCHPETERDELSVLERVRRLERLAEEGAYSRPARTTAGGGAPEGYAGGGSGGPNGSAADGASGSEGDAAEAQPAVYQRVAPEELQQVCGMWTKIISRTQGRFRAVLASAQPRYNAQDKNDGRLYVVFADFLADCYIDDEQKKAELEEIIRDQTGKSVEVKFVLKADESIQKETLAAIELEEKIHELIHADIEIE